MNVERAKTWVVWSGVGLFLAAAVAMILWFNTPAGESALRVAFDVGR